MMADPTKRLRDVAQQTGDLPPRIAYYDPTKPPDDWVSSVPHLPRVGSAVVRRLSEVRPEEVSWLWPQRIALGKLTMLAGDPGLGKSFVSLDLAARVSAGLPWPDLPLESPAPGGVVLLSAEDGLADTIRPRLDASGADASRIVALEAVRTINEGGDPGERSLDLSRDLGAIEDAIQQAHPCRLVIIDPITAYTGDRDSHNNAEIRGLLAPLAKLAEEHGLAMVAVSHLNKGKGGAAIYRTMGSLAFVAAARAAWIVVKDQQDPKRRLLVSAKNNLGDDSSGLAYRIEPVGVDGAPAVAWEPDPLQLTADDLLGASTGSGSGARDEAEEWLRDMLSDGPRPAAELKEQAKADGIAQRTLDRAKNSLGIVSKREGHENRGRWMWYMPQPRGSDPKPVF